MHIIEDINVAQKTVNTRGTKELLTSSITLDISAATTEGNPAIANILQTINLNGNINDYDFINIQIAIDTTQRKYISKINNFSVPRIVYNNTNTFNNLDGSALFISNDVHSQSSGSFGVVHFILRGWFKTNNQIYLDVASNPIVSTAFNKMTIMSIQGVKVVNTTIDPVEYVNTDKGIEDSPVGHILSQMGKVAPKHYLICDGATYNIVDYPHLSQYIKDQFGTFNYFGGNGITTFTVPDLRNEFLRGYYGDKTEKLSGDIGKHQDATQHINFVVDSGSHIYLNGEYGTSGVLTNAIDKLIPSSNSRGWTNTGSLTNWSAVGGYTKYTSRPTNTAVLYCIKYEPTYFMSIQGLIEETVLFEGNIGTDGTTAVSNTINLLDSIDNYDKLGIYFYSIYNVSTKHYDYKEIPKDEIIPLIDSKPTNTYVSCLFGYQTSPAYTNILPVTSTHSSLFINQNQSHITKVIGIKYKTYQS